MNLHAPKGIDVENWFIECYRKYKGHPMWILLGLYKGNYNKFFMAVVFFFIKHCPVWVLPIITANIINDITSGAPDAYQHIFIEAIIMVVLIALNIPTNYMYTRYKSLATRYAETGLRKALVRKLQQLSISYHKETQSGRLQSKIMRDVEAVETLSTQMFLSILNIALNIIIALAVTISKSMVVIVFFLLTTPIAALTMVFFRNVMRRRNTEFRKEMEETSAKVMEMVELIPVTRAHALEEEEVHKMSGQLFAVAEKGYKPTLFDKNKKPGGMVTYGIPSFVMEKDVVEAEVDVLREMGVDIRLGVEVGKDITLKQLREEGYKAFYIAIGCQGGRGVNVPGEDAEGVMKGVDLLHTVIDDESYTLSGDTVVIGGGNVAIDVSRTAVRCGSPKVTQVSL